MAPGQHACSQESPKGCSSTNLRMWVLEGAGCPQEAPQHSRVVAVPLVPAPQVGEQGEGSAGGDADRHLDAEGEELVLLQRVHPHLGEHRARAGTRSPPPSPPGLPTLWGREAASGGGDGGGFSTFSFSLASAQFALATSVFSAETLL